MKMEQTDCSEATACKIQTPGNCAEESIQHSERSESLKSTAFTCINFTIIFCYSWEITDSPVDILTILQFGGKTEVLGLLLPEG